ERLGGDEQPLEASVEVGGPGEAQLLERKGGKARGVALVADQDDRLIRAGDLGEAVRRGRVEPPLEHVAVHDDGAGKLAVAGALLDRPDVHDQRPQRPQGRELRSRGAMREPAADPLQDLVDSGADVTLDSAHRAAPGSGAPSTTSVRSGTRKASRRSS